MSYCQGCADLERKLEAARLAAPHPDTVRLVLEKLELWVCPHCDGKGSLPHISGGRHRCSTCAPIVEVLDAARKERGE